METSAKYRLMGAFTLAAIFGVFAFVYWLNHGGGLGERSIYHIRFLGPVPGLRPGAAVQFNGIRVGEVTSLELDANTPQQVTAAISIDAATPVRADTQVSIDFQGLMGVTSIALKGGAPTAPRLTATRGVSPLLVADASAGADLTATARDALRRLDGILADNAEALRGTIANFNTFTGALAKNADRVDNIVAGLERMTGGDGSKAQALSFDLEAPRSFPPFKRRQMGQLAIGEPTALIVFDSQKLVMRAPSGGRMQMPGNVQWGDTLPKLIQARIIQTFENAVGPASVVRMTDNLAADRQLLLEIRSFELVTGEQPFAKVEFAAKLIADGNRVLEARTFSSSAAATGADAAAAAAALDKAFGEAAIELTLWAEKAP